MYLRRRNQEQANNPPYFYFNMADDSHAKILKKSRKIDPMQLIGQIVEMDEY